MGHTTDRCITCESNLMIACHRICYYFVVGYETVVACSFLDIKSLFLDAKSLFLDAILVFINSIPPILSRHPSLHLKFQQKYEKESSLSIHFKYLMQFVPVKI